MGVSVTPGAVQLIRMPLAPSAVTLAIPYRMSASLASRYPPPSLTGSRVSLAPFDAFSHGRGVQQPRGDRGVVPVGRGGQRRDARDRRPGWHRRDQRLGEMPGAEEVDRHDPQRVADPRRHARDVEQGIDRDRRLHATAVSIDAGSDRSSSWNSLSCKRGRLHVKTDDLGAELGELPRDARRRCRSHIR